MRLRCLCGRRLLLCQLGLRGDLLLLHGHLLLALPPLLQELPGRAGAGIVQLLHLRPKQDQRVRCRRIPEGAGLEVQARLLPHGLPIAGQRLRRVAGKQKLIVPPIVAVCVLLQEIVAVELRVLCLTLAVLVAHRPRLVGVRQPELEHELEQRGVGRVLHDALALQASRRLCGAELFGHAARRRGVLAALEAVRDAQELPRLLVDVGQVQQLVLQVALEVVDADHGLVRCAAQEPALAVLRIRAEVRLVREGDARARLHQAVDDLLLHPVHGVLLVADHIHVAIAQQLAVDAHAALEDDGVEVRLVERNERRLHARLAGLADAWVHPGDLQAGARRDGHHDLLELLLLARKLFAAAPGAGAAVVALRLRRFARLHFHVRHDALCRHAVHGRVRHLLRQDLPRQLPAGDILRNESAGKAARRIGEEVALRVLLAVPDDLAGQRTHAAALLANRLAPRLVILQVLQLHVVHPGIAVDAAAVVDLEADVLRQRVLRHILGAGGAHVRLALRFLPDVDVVLALDGLLRGWDLDDEPVHVRNGRVDARLRAELFGVDHVDRDLAHSVMRALGIVPLDQEAHAALNGHRALRHVVHGLEREAVQLVPEEVLDDVRQMLVLLPPRRHLRLRDGGGDLRLHVLENDVADVAGPLLFTVPFCVAHDQGLERVVSVIQSLPFVHLLDFGLERAGAVGQALLPGLQLRAFCRFFLLHHVSVSYLLGCPHKRIRNARSSSLALL